MFSYVFFVGCSYKSIELSKEDSKILSKLGDSYYALDKNTISYKAKFKDGYYEEDYLDSTDKVVVKLGKENALGDLNSDGLKDAVTTLYASSGGEESFVFLATLINEDKKDLKSLEALLLGDRIKVKSLQIKAGYILIDYLTHKFHESKSSKPTREMFKVFEIKNEKIVDVTKTEPEDIRFKKMDLTKFNLLWKKSRRKNASWLKHPLRVVQKYIGHFEGYEQSIAIEYNFPVDPTKAIIKIEEKGYPDDAVAGGYYIFELERQKYNDWAMISAKESWTCTKGRGHSDYSYDLCR